MRNRKKEGGKRERNMKKRRIKKACEGKRKTEI
jgi:hypothetical protein